MLTAAQPNLVMLQPRRIATRAAAARIGEENNWTLGEEVGYQVRFEKRITARTRLRVITEAILTRQLLDDPSLDGVGCVVLDEFHERSIHSDLAIALLNEVRQSLRDDLMIVVMSATLEAEPVAAFLGQGGTPAPIVRVPGRTFPVDISHRPRSGDRLEDAIADVVVQQPDDGHTLVFLPGAQEISWAQQAILDRLPNRRVLPLHGSLSFEEQQRAIAPSREPKIVLATNIAETSLTIDGVKTVIDSGLARKPRFDPQRGLDSLNLERISKASAAQRAGRAGRTAAGRCIRLWTQQEHQLLDAFDSPEIARVDLAPTLLDLHAWGQSDPRTFGWYEAPPADALDHAENLLKMLGALDVAGKMTPLGKRMHAMPVHPRLARLLIAAEEAGASSLGAAVAALLSEKDFVYRERKNRQAIGSRGMLSSSDVVVRLHLLEESERGGFNRGRVPEGVDAFAARQVSQARDQLLRMSRRPLERNSATSAHPSPRWGEGRVGAASGQGRAIASPPAGDTADINASRSKPSPYPLPSGEGGAIARGAALDEDTLVRQLTLLAYPDRVCRRRSDVRTGTMVGGVGVRLDDDCSVIEGDFFVAVDPRQDDRARNREAWVRIASAVDVEWLETLFPQSIRRERIPEYDEARGRVIVRVRTSYLDLVLNETVDTRLDREGASELLAAALRDQVPSMIAEDEKLSGLLARVALLRQHFPEKGFPSFDDEWSELLVGAARGKQSKPQVQQALYDAVRNRLVYPLDRLLEEHAPETIEVPTGSNIKLQYNADPAKPPILAVRLQELFGLAETPRIAGGRVPVLLHLLGPNYRPVQVTQDLASFWKNTYAQVRKDLRAQYPKHSWPDDPLTAPPVRGAKRRRSH